MSSGAAGNVVALRPRIITSTEAVAPELLRVLKGVRDWMDEAAAFPLECPIPNPLASDIRLAIARAELRR